MAEPLSVSDAAWFRTPEVQSIFDCLNRDGYEVRAVGGAVRNALIGRGVCDVDFATTAPPECTVYLASRAGLKAVPTGFAHGTITLVAGGTPFEVTTLRADVETDGRHAVVAFGQDWTADAKRRDLTMNSLLADGTGHVFDPLDGLDDVLAGRVRFIGEARLRLREDYLRILRFFRFSADYAAGEFDPDGVEACVAEREGLSRLSGERVRSELLKILVSRRAVEAIRILDTGAILSALLRGNAFRARFERLSQIETSLGLTADPLVRLAALGVTSQDDAVRLKDTLRLSTSDTDKLSGWLSTDFPSDAALDGGARSRLYRLGSETYRGQLLLAAAKSDTVDVEALRAHLDFAARWQRRKFPVSGADLIAAGWKPGRELGLKLEELESYWVEHDFMPGREDLLRQCNTGNGGGQR